MTRWKLLPLVVAVLALAVLVLPQTASAQQLVDLTCTGGGTGRADPGVRLLPSPQHITAELKAGSSFSPGTPCTSLTGTPYQGMTIDMEGAGELGCLGGKVTGTANVTWDNGDRSTAAWSLNLPIFLIPIFDFRVTQGALKGARLFAFGVPTGFTGNCALNPLTHLGGIGVGLVSRF